MENEIKKKGMEQQNASDHLANERTLLAWIRTGIAIMAFGFVVVKFSLFLKQVAFLVSGRELTGARTSSGYLGIGIVIIGALTLLLSFIKYKKTEHQLLAHEYKTSSRLLLLLILVICVMSVFLISYLLGSMNMS